MKKAVNVQISRDEDQYIAQSLDVPFVTQARTLDDLVASIREAVKLALSAGDAALFDMIEHPSIVANIIVDSPEYA
jgi:hypothetical protein